jgi:hypothetical protein
MSPKMTRCSCCNAIVDGVVFRVGGYQSKKGEPRLGWCDSCTRAWQLENELVAMERVRVSELPPAPPPMSEQIRAALKARSR